MDQVRARARALGRVVGLLAVAALAAAGCGGDDGGSASAGPTGSTAGGGAGAPDLADVTLRVGIQSSGSSVNRAILEASGAFDDAPYTLDWADFDGANAAVEALNAGAVDLDIGLNSSAPVLAQANAKQPWTADGAPFKVIAAARSDQAPGIAIVVHDDSGIRDVAGLAGKKVSFAKGTANHYFFSLAARDAGLAQSDVELVLMPLSEARAAFVGGAVDALVTSVSNARPLVRADDARILTTSAGRFATYSFVVARTDVLGDPGATAAIPDFLERLQAAAEWEATHVEEVVDLWVDVAKQPLEDAELSAVESVAWYVPIDDEVVAAQQDQADVFHAEGVAASPVDVRIGIDDRFDATLPPIPAVAR